MSKTLELLEELKKSHFVDGRLPLIAKCRFDKIEQELKALEFIRERFGSFILIVTEYDLRTSKEEYVLLKEVFRK